MGYYSTLEFHGKVKKYDKEKLEKLNRILTGEEEGPFEVWGFEGGKFIVDEDGSFYVELDDYTAKFYDDSDVAHYLAEVIQDGFAQMILTGEDGATGGYYITPGNVVSLIGVYVPEPILDKVEKILDEYYRNSLNENKNETGEENYYSPAP